MAGVGTNGAIGAYQAYMAQNETQKNAKAKEADAAKKTAGSKAAKEAGYGKTIGEPQLSEKAQKYYDQLKKKYGNYDFILVSKDEKENAKANAGKYANRFKTVVLIDEEKIERMATDENYRKKYEGILSGAGSQLQQLKASMEKSGANVKGYGMQVNDNGTTSLFAVLKKSSADQKTRIEKSTEKKKAEKKAAEKKAAKKEEQDRLHKTGKWEKDSRVEKEDDEEYEIITADSVEELMKKVDDFYFLQRSDSVMTQEEQMVGQHFDIKS